MTAENKEDDILFGQAINIVSHHSIPDLDNKNHTKNFNRKILKIYLNLKKLKKLSKDSEFIKRFEQEWEDLINDKR